MAWEPGNVACEGLVQGLGRDTVKPSEMRIQDAGLLAEGMNLAREGSESNQIALRFLLRKAGGGDSLES